MSNRQSGILAVVCAVGLFTWTWIPSFVMIKDFYPVVNRTAVSLVKILTSANMDTFIVTVSLALLILSIINALKLSPIIAVINLVITGVLATGVVVAFVIYLSDYAYNYFGFAGVVYIIFILANIFCNIVITGNTQKIQRGEYDFSDVTK